ncbi:hypothetical protein H9Q70_000702 [Fusarium xylarioides]|nr:hypothetical protein H9Q70_000702 [Fusarium xylarioides]KAG5818407.1 hypothetical protein H9Q74_010081 [Fusarium xylarioides]KAG5819852.1 hypothetical protein H9Q71_000825 [Fusarium xylarioides]
MFLMSPCLVVHTFKFHVKVTQNLGYEHVEIFLHVHCLVSVIGGQHSEVLVWRQARMSIARVVMSLISTMFQSLRRGLGSVFVRVAHRHVPVAADDRVCLGDVVAAHVYVRAVINVMVRVYVRIRFHALTLAPVFSTLYILPCTNDVRRHESLIKYILSIKMSNIGTGEFATLLFAMTSVPWSVMLVFLALNERVYPAPSSG